MMLDASDATPAHATTARRQRLRAWQVLLALFCAFVLAQLFGKLAGDTAAWFAHAKADALSGPVVVPAMLASEFALLLVSLLTPLLAAKPIGETLGLGSASPRVFVAACLGTVALGPLGDRLMSLFSELFPKLTLGVVPALHELAQSLPFVWLWPSFALLPGVSEELLFRGVLQRSIARPRIAIVVSGCAFALFHVDPVHVVGVLPLGLFLAWAAQRSSTSVSIVAHVINNSLAVISIKSDSFDMGYGADQELPWPWVAASLVLFALAAGLLAHDTVPRSAATPSALA